MSLDIPPAPPEAEVIRLARKAMDMTAESAAHASRSHDSKGVSAAYWRDVERGYGGRRGQRVPVRASDRALAAMARVVGVTPGQLAAAGRDDAALVLEEALRRSAVTVVPQPAALSAVGDAMDAAGYAVLIRQRLADLAGRGIQRPDGETLFQGDGGDPFKVGGYVSAGMTAAWDMAMAAPIDLDTAARLAGKTWVNLNAHRAARNTARGAGSVLTRRPHNNPRVFSNNPVTTGQYVLLTAWPAL